MAESRSSKREQAVRLNDEATEVFERGTKARQFSDDYMRIRAIVIIVGNRFHVPSETIRLPKVTGSPGLDSRYTQPVLRRFGAWVGP